MRYFSPFIFIVWLLIGCQENTFKEPLSLGGKTVAPQILNAGKINYQAYCIACHGTKGDGKGIASKGLRPPPRDFTQGTFKFMAVASGELPNDEDFVRIIRRGLHGTAMLEWKISDQRLNSIIQYIKTFSERWQSESPGDPITPTPDPYGAEKKEIAIELGKKLYHGKAQCLACHPSYATKKEIYDATKELLGQEITDFRDQLYTSVLKESDYGVKLLPPDFTWHQLRSGSNLEDLYRTISAGIGGTAMPAWRGALPEEELWAMAYYVKSLTELRNTPEREKLRASLLNQPEFIPPKK